MSRQQCDEENQKSLAAEATAAEEARQKQIALKAQIERDEASRGYRKATVRDLRLDGAVYAAARSRVSVSGFYKQIGRRNERLFDSYSDFMMHTYQTTEAINIGLLTENANRNVREYLMTCRGACEITILGHVDRCTETNMFGAKADDVCLVAEDMRRN